MNLLDQLVDEAIQNLQNLAPLRTVVEKELLHHDILRILSDTNLLIDLTFIGGTCLRLCYGAERLSEDLDFTGGADFTREKLANMSDVLIDTLGAKYGLPIEVTPPTREEGNVKTWKLKVITRPKNKHIPSQRINIDICAIPSHQIKPMMLQNPYGVEMGTSGLIIQAESLEEIFTDKIISFALRRGRIKNRDLWDIMWLQKKGIQPLFELIPAKLHDHKCEKSHFIHLLQQRQQMLLLPETTLAFHEEMRRFIPKSTVEKTIDNALFWEALVNLINSLCDKAFTSC
ncbi:MAG: nucleotidyl transferase AbiEii/AbiGii toxin family protein [Gammaproteobacteria bacterium]